MDEMELYQTHLFLNQYQQDCYYQEHVMPKYEEQLNPRLKKVLNNAN